MFNSKENGVNEDYFVLNNRAILMILRIPLNLLIVLIGNRLIMELLKSLSVKNIEIYLFLNQTNILNF